MFFFSIRGTGSSEVAWVSGLPKGIGETRFLIRFHLSPFPPETPDTQASSEGKIILLSSALGKIKLSRWKPVVSPNIVLAPQ